MKKNKKNLIKKVIISLYIVIAVLMILLCVIVFKIISNNISEDEEEEVCSITIELETQEIESQTVEETEEIQSTIPVEEVDYPKPEYDFKLEEITIEIPDLTKEYTIAWVSDLHLISDLQETDDVKAEFIETINARYDSMFVTEDGLHSNELWPEVVKFLNYEEFDGIIFGGDMMDYCSKNNMDVFMQEYNKLNKNIPLLYIRADHDYGFWYGGETLTEPMAFEMHKEIDGDDLNDKYLDFGEFIIVGVNRSVKDIPQHQYNIIESQYNQGNPVIAVTHVPYESVFDNTDSNRPDEFVSLEELSMAVRNKVYYWTYFSNQGQYIPNDVTRKYMDFVYSENTSVCKVLAGHLHSPWDGMIS